jgi:uncharacterized phage protein (TIGR01671 family)
LDKEDKVREIKFRIFDNGKMITPALEIRGNETSWSFVQSGYGDVSSKRIIMQYTGLKDKNGKEIYEGDIVIANEDGFDGTKHQVIYCGDRDYPAFDLLPYVDTDSNGLSYYKATGSLEVIGNIYENPELLKDV